ncbi:MAG: hypothetical protein JXA71_08230 [Chitinispirillaceae bacterium]|nr:hypothetical protein [Chitinispirillaceae bacterium]
MDHHSSPSLKDSPSGPIEAHLSRIKELKDSLPGIMESELTVSNPHNVISPDQIRHHKEKINSYKKKLVLDEISWREQEIERLKQRKA